MKILYLVNESDLPEMHAIVGVKTRGANVIVCGEPNSLLAGAASRHGFPWVPQPWRGRWDNGAVRTVRELVAREKPDIIHAFTNRSLATALRATDGNALVLGYRGTEGNVHWWDPGAWLTYLHPRLSGIWCNSQAVARSLRVAGISDAKLRVVYKGHSPAWYTKYTRDSRSEFAVPENALLFLCVANARPLKGVKSLLEAFSHALPQLPPEALLMLVGEMRDDTLERMLQSAPLRGRVIATGYRADASSLPALADVFIMPSLRREGFPKAVIEAMSSGLPCVVTQVGGMPEQVRHELDGLVVPPADATALAQAMVRLASSVTERDAFGMNARRQVSEKFGIEQTVSGLVDWYTSLTGLTLAHSKPLSSPATPIAPSGTQCTG